MGVDYEKEIIKLGKACVEISTELNGVKNVLEKLTANQTILIRLSEKTNMLEKDIDQATTERDKISLRLHKIEECRLNHRIASLETQKSWFRATFVGALVSVIVGLILLGTRFLLT